MVLSYSSLIKLRKTLELTLSVLLHASYKGKNHLKKHKIIQTRGPLSFLVCFIAV